MKGEGKVETRRDKSEGKQDMKMDVPIGPRSKKQTMVKVALGHEHSFRPATPHMDRCRTCGAMRRVG
jgi:hypothetical protein